MIKILIADDHAVVRKGIKQILIEEYPTAIITEVGDAEDLIKNVMTSNFDIVISDLNMPGRSGLDALQQIKKSHPQLPVLILSVHAEEQYAIRILKAGGDGYLSKESAPVELVNAVKRILLGKKYISQEVAEKLANNLSSNPGKQLQEYLSDREFDVMKLLATGKSITEIAEMLSLSVTTVSTYRSRLMLKMNLKTNADLTKYALENKLI